MTDNVAVVDHIINGLVHNKKYIQKVYPFLKEDYFDLTEKIVFLIVQDHYLKYDSAPSPEVVQSVIEDNDTLNEQIYTDVSAYIKQVLPEPYTSDFSWLVDETEKYCSQKAVYNALVQSIAIADGEDTETPKTAIPDLLSDALAVSFSDDVGLDYDDMEERWERLNRAEAKIPFRLKVLNEITDNGFETKSLNIIIAATGVGKTAFMVDYAASQLWEGKSVLYVTMEMAEEKIANRIDANMMDISFKELKKVGKEEFFLRCKKIKKANIGKLYVKEFPTSTAGAVEVDHLIKELYQKKGFVPDILCVDYISICKSSRVKLSQGSYLYVKSIAEEFRALAMKHDLVCLSATQTNRDGIDASDFSLKAISESAGLAHTVDWALALMSPEDIAEQGLALAKQLKSRYGDINYMRKFVLGYARDKSYFYDTDLDYDVITGGGAVEDEDIPAFDQATSGAFGAELPDPTVSIMNPMTRPTKNDKSGVSW